MHNWLSALSCIEAVFTAADRKVRFTDLYYYSLFHSVLQAALLNVQGIKSRLTDNEQTVCANEGRISVVLYVLYFLMFAWRIGGQHPHMYVPTRRRLSVA